MSDTGEGYVIQSDVYEITDVDDWATRVDHAPGPVFVEFFVNWCPHCQREAPILDSVVEGIEADGIDVYRANAEVMYMKGSVYGLEETPSFIVVKDGELVSKHEGFFDADELVAFAHSAN